jgi:hypothetical protein
MGIFCEKKVYLKDELIAISPPELFLCCLNAEEMEGLREGITFSKDRYMFTKQIAGFLLKNS